MKNKKGFTLIELLAVVVILAIIMVVAIPKIIDVINGSRNSAWLSNVKLIKKSIELNTRGNGYTIKGLCNDNETTSDVTVTNKIKEIASFDDTNITCKKDTNYIFTLTGINNFSGKSATITCTYDSICTYDISSDSNVEQVSDPVSFSTDSWATIAQNPTSSSYQVGNEKTIQMDVDGDGNNETYTLRIVNKEACTNSNLSQTACGFVLEFKEILNITNNDDGKMNYTATNVNGWRDSKMRVYLNTTIYNKLPSDLKSVIINTKVISGNGRTTEELTHETNDKLYLLSTKEIGYAIDRDATNDSTLVLKYYENSSASDRIKSDGARWWLRAADAYNSTNFLRVTWNGGVDNYYATYTSGVSPAFRIGVN